MICCFLISSVKKKMFIYSMEMFLIHFLSFFNECVTGLQSVLSASLNNGEDEGQLIMYSVLVLWPGFIMVEHKRSLCACLSPEPGHIPELLLDTAVPLSEEAPDRPAAPHSQDLPENPKDLQGLAGESLVSSIMIHDFNWPQRTRAVIFYCVPTWQ